LVDFLPKGNSAGEAAYAADPMKWFEELKSNEILSPHISGQLTTVRNSLEGDLVTG
jgi:hypothetical protein